jgi:hypothetical protein
MIFRGGTQKGCDTSALHCCTPPVIFGNLRGRPLETL